MTESERRSARWAAAMHGSAIHAARASSRGMRVRQDGVLAAGPPDT
jgi:hypothetical protein